MELLYTKIIIIKILEYKKMTKQNIFQKINSQLFNQNQIDLDSDDKNFINIQSDFNNQEEIEEKFQYQLTKHGLDKMVSIDIVKKWMKDLEREEDKERIPAQTVLTMLFGLLHSQLHGDDFNDFVGAIINFCNSLSCSKKDISPSKPENLQSSTINLERASEYYNRALDLTKKSNYNEALNEYNEYFKILHEDRTTHSEIYRCFANMATIMFYKGKEYDGKRLLEISLEINPNYDFAIQVMQRYQAGELQGTIMNGRMRDIQEKIEAGEHPLDRWNQEEIKEKWSDQRILDQLSDFGIQITKEDFMQKSKKIYSIEDFFKKYFTPYFTGNEKDQDFIRYATSALWSRWCDQMVVEDFFALIADLQELTESGFPKKKINKKLIEINDFISKAPVELLKKSENYFEMIVFKDSLIFLLNQGFVDQVLEIATKFLDKMDFPQMKIIEVGAKIIRNEEWEDDFQELLKAYPNDPLPYNDLAFIFAGLNNHLQEEKYLKKAFREVEKREEKNINHLGYRFHNIYDDYMLTLEALEELYLKIDNQEGLNWVENKIEEVENKREELDKNHKGINRDKVMSNFIQEVEKKEFVNNPACIYYDYLKKFQINFKTDQLTSSPVFRMSANGQIMESGSRRVNGRKIGRNEPCPCGSSKKFKKCCGR